MLKDFIRNFFKTRYYFNPFIKYQISKLEDNVYLNRPKRETPITVSLASSRENFNRLPITIYSLLNQSLKPDRIVLWLNEEYEDLANLPYEISQFIKNGLDIKFVKDFKNYTKTFCALKEFPNDIIVIASDNVYYPKNWLKELYLSYISHPEDIHINSAKSVSSQSLNSKRWKSISKPSADFSYIPCSSSGVLYPPNCFSKEVFRKDVFLKQVQNNDSLWFWLMGIINNHKFRIVKNNYKKTIYTNIIKSLQNNTLQNNTLDQEFDNLKKLYGNNIKQKL